MKYQNLRKMVRYLDVEMDMCDEANIEREILLSKLGLSLSSRAGSFAIIMMKKLSDKYPELSDEEIFNLGHISGKLFYSHGNQKVDNIINEISAIVSEHYKLDISMVIKYNYNIIFIVETLINYVQKNISDYEITNKKLK